ncbi:hypothetical protein POM88_014151 [Heracleum sosnowskyi]|uniref:DNA2/NAM7 helicase helicase domain-containing protein n=1 Tax=Heracleum sosnowskyi TaxID=360622 RepID=A0AAD8J3J7_9APIA|nr:hypothetical protein POM88_014151 [Heracleum sosnowskyi]
MESISAAPFSKVISLQQSKQFRKLHYETIVEDWKHSSDSVDKEPYWSAKLHVNITSLVNPLTINNLVAEELKEAYLLEGKFEFLTRVNVNISTFLHFKRESVRFLRTLMSALDELDLPTCSKDSIEEFCYRMATLIFCTASSAYKLQSVKMYPMKLLVIDEAAQLRECESLIPLQVPSIKHTVLLGDECQLPAFVTSKVASYF